MTSYENLWYWDDEDDIQDEEPFEDDPLRSEIESDLYYIYY